MTESKTTFLGRRIGYNEGKRKQARAQKMKRRVQDTFRWFKRRGWILCVLLIVAGVALWTNRFYVQRFNPLELRHLRYIDIEGNRMLSWEDVIQNAQVEPGMLMSEVYPDSIEKMLIQVPLIRSVRVQKHFRLRCPSCSRNRRLWLRTSTAERRPCIPKGECRSRFRHRLRSACRLWNANR